jgi:integrase
VKVLLAAQVDRVKALERKLGRIIPCLFPHLRQGHTAKALAGTRRVDFRRAWITACAKAGVPGKLRHDFRRTAARNLVRRNVPERVAMTITGHLTRSVFDRYNIVSDGDLGDAARKLSTSPSGTDGMFPGITGPLARKPALEVFDLMVAAGGLEPPTRGL